MSVAEIDLITKDLKTFAVQERKFTLSIPLNVFSYNNMAGKVFRQLAKNKRAKLGIRPVPSCKELHS